MPWHSKFTWIWTRWAFGIKAKRASQSTLQRFIRGISLALPPTLYIASLVLILATIFNPDYMRADRLTTGSPDDSGQITNHTEHLSPWYTCNRTILPPSDFKEVCIRRPAYGAAGRAACEAEFLPQYRLCEGIVITAELYLAAAVLGGVASFLAFIYGIIAACQDDGPLGNYVQVDTGHEEQSSRPPSRSEQRAPTARSLSNLRVSTSLLGSLATLLALAAGGCLVFGQAQGIITLIVEASPTIRTPLEDETRWYMSKGSLQLTSAAYVLAFIGAYIGMTGHQTLPTSNLVYVISREDLRENIVSSCLWHHS